VEENWFELASRKQEEASAGEHHGALFFACLVQIGARLRAACNAQALSDGF
jgi:hypothetical protein